MNKKYCLNPRDFDLGGTEKYYSDMAARGWRLVRRGVFLSSFQRSEPEEMRYRVEIISPKLLQEGRPPEEQLAVYEDCGWEYVTGREFHHIFRAPAHSGAPEFYLEPEQQAETLKGLRWQYVISALSPLLALLFCLLFSFLFWDVSSGHWTAAFFHAWVEGPELILGYVLLLFSLTLHSIWGSFYLSRLCRRMKAGVPLDHAPTGRHWLPRVISALAWTCAIVCLGWAFFGDQTYPMPLETEEPYILLCDLGVTGERVPNFVNESQTSEVSHRRSLLSESWDTCEFLEGQQWLYQEVYVLKNPDMMDRFVTALMYDSVFARSPEPFNAVTVPGLDRAWVAGPLEFIAVKDNTVAIFDHNGTSLDDAENSLALIAQKWAAMS